MFVQISLHFKSKWYL